VPFQRIEELLFSITAQWRGVAAILMTKHYSIDQAEGGKTH
jgi:hypothetical protein